jgi:predicted AAA+ superfamily ATPase
LSNIKSYDIIILKEKKVGESMSKIVKDSVEYKPRIIDATIRKYLSVFGAVCVEGPKWCGKSWTSSYHSNSEFLVGDPSGNFQNRRLAELDPVMILEGDTPRLIDEWQEVPAIWDAVRYTVDKSGKKGQFILTGSSTPKRKGILHSGAGRIATIKMRTMSLYESGESSGVVSLEDLCNGILKTIMIGEVNLLDIANYVVRGGWPGNITNYIATNNLLSQSYLEAIIRDDSYRLDDKRYDTNKMKLLLRSLARNISTTATNNKLINDIKAIDDADVDRDTVALYLDVFERLFLLDNQPPFSPNIRSSIRIKQAEKRHFCDPSLACALLKMTPEMLMGDLQTFGFLFESLCVRDLKIYAESFGAKVYHYQDYKNQEIDAVIELSDGSWCAFEIKLGANQIDKAAQNLIKIKEKIKSEGGNAPSVLCVLCGLSNAAYAREDGVFVVPITALKN